MYECTAATWHMLIDWGILCGYFLLTSTQDLEYQSQSQTQPLPSDTRLPTTPPDLLPLPLCIVLEKYSTQTLMDLSPARYAR